MKQYFAQITALLMLAVAGQAMASDRELCQAGFPVMLMTETECQIYLDKRKSLQQTGDLASLRQLDAQLRDQLIDRSVACPCAAEAPVKIALSQNDGC
jgi:hypothetical protein